MKIIENLDKKYDYVIVGSGLFGSVFAKEMTEKGFSCVLLEKRNHIAGNCYTDKIDNIDVHIYGPHIFRTNSKKIWDYVNNLCEFKQYCNRVKVKYEDKLYSFPINLFTFYQLWGITSPDAVNKKLDEVRLKIDNPKNLEEHLLSEIGEELYRKFFYGYTKKQWGKEPKYLPKSIVSRIPIRTNMDDNYYSDKYQGIPLNGYTEMFLKMLENVDVMLSVDYNKNREFYNKFAKIKVVYTGPIDEFFDYDMGVLEWRSLRFENQTLDVQDFQGNAVVNYTEEQIPYTRITEHKHFLNNKTDKTIITKEYPQSWDKNKEKYYPINDDKNNKLYNLYKQRVDESRFIFGGRLAEYKYYDMHQVIASAIVCSEKQLKNEINT